MEIIYTHVSIFNIVIKDTSSLYPRVAYICVFFLREKGKSKQHFKS